MDLTTIKDLQKLSIFKVGVVCSVDGRSISVKVDKNKNLSHLLYQGSLIKNVSVGHYVKILKGFIRIIAKVESEKVKEEPVSDKSYYSKEDLLQRFLVVKLIGYFENGKYCKGVKEMPLIGNECVLLDNEEFSFIHKFASHEEPTISIGSLLIDENVSIEISINKLFSSHIGIFGNTGSGKSYTLASLYKNLFDKVGNNKNFKQNAKFLLFDFNGEYSAENVIIKGKKSYCLSTRDSVGGDKIPLTKNDLINPELFYILASATEKTQQPFIKRTLDLYKRVQIKDNPVSYMQAIIRRLVERVVCMGDYTKAKLLLDYFEDILPHQFDSHDEEIGLLSDIQWHGKNTTFYTEKEGEFRYFNADDGKKYIPQLILYKAVDSYNENLDFLSLIIKYLYVQLIQDVLNNRANNEHIAPAINKLKSLSKDFDKVFLINDTDIWAGHNFVVVDMNKVNLNMKKLIPLLVSYKLYSSHKSKKDGVLSESLNIIVDEAHNILSYESMRESESWKDFRLETFEEIIKEGRKFGVFLTIASQRPSDISPTIISQLHNYFIHRLVNNRDLEMVEKAISYLDKLSVESLPILPVGACVLSGIIADLPVIIQVNKLDDVSKPTSDTIDLIDNWIDSNNTQNN